MNQPFRTIAATLALFATAAGSALAQDYGPWGDPQAVTAIDTAAAEGCPIESPDGLALYFASNRSGPGAQGKLDNYRALRVSTQSDWSATENLGPVATSAEFDYCPTPLSGDTLLFVSSRQTTDDCYPGDAPPPPPTGGPSAGDIFMSEEDSSHTFSMPVNLGCAPNGPNTPGAEFSPSRVSTPDGTFLFFSSNGYADSEGQDIYMSEMLGDGSVTAGVRVAELSTAADDRMPNVRADGLEIVFSSNRAGATPFDQDIYVATRSDTHSPWSAPMPVGNAAIDTAASETRASLSADGTRLYFGRKLDGSDPGDVFVATRVRAVAGASVHPAPTLSAPVLALLAALIGATAWFAQRRRDGTRQATATSKSP